MGKIYRAITLLMNAFAILTQLSKYDPLRLMKTKENENFFQKVLEKSPEMDEFVFEPSIFLLNGYVSTWLNAYFSSFHKLIFSKL